MITDSNYLDTQNPENPDVVRRHPKFALAVALFQAKPNNCATPKEWLLKIRWKLSRDSNYLDMSLNGLKVALRGAIIAIASCNLGFEVVT